MPAPASSVHLRLQSALKPFVDNQHDWLFHYPVYINTFCLTYDLACLVSRKLPSQGADSLGGNFIRHDWWTGLPAFTYQRDIEIFVAVDGTIEDAKRQGHRIERDQTVRFTRYDVRWVYLRARPASARPPHKWLLVTDLEQNGRQLIRNWRNTRPTWQRQGPKIELDDEAIRLTFRRELHDLFSDDGKVYLLSAPIARVFKQLAKRSQPKYVQQKAGMTPIDTYFVFRCNSGVSINRVQALRAAIEKYYRILFSAKDIAAYLNGDVARQYARIASTIGQPHPFPEIYSKKPITSQANRKMLHLYAEILRDHHRP